jgi:hypothetical protein
LAAENLISKVERWQSAQRTVLGGLQDERLHQVELVRRPQLKIYQYGRITKKDFESLVSAHNSDIHRASDGSEANASVEETVQALKETFQASTMIKDYPNPRERIQYIREEMHLPPDNVIQYFNIRSSIVGYIQISSKIKCSIRVITAMPKNVS